MFKQAFLKLAFYFVYIIINFFYTVVATQKSEGRLLTHPGNTRDVV